MAKLQPFRVCVFTQIALLSSMAWCTKGQIIKEHPLSLLIPTNQIGSFSCRAICRPNACNGFWIVDDYHSQLAGDAAHLESRGFTITHAQLTNQTTNEYSLALTVNASLSVNNSQIVCEFTIMGIDASHNRSTPATLIVLSDSPLSSNPAICIERNTTHLLLKWSAPFLWPGVRIDHYNASQSIDDYRGKITHNNIRVNTTHDLSVLTTFALAIATYSSTLEVANCTCTSVNFTFFVSPVPRAFESSSLQLPAFSASETVPRTAPVTVQFPSSAVNVSVLFKGDGTPAWILVFIQMPMMCGNKEEKNYTILVESSEGALTALTAVGHSPHLGAETVRDVISSDLRGNKEYSLRVVAETDLQTVSFEKLYFSTSFKSDSKSANALTELQTYQLIVGVSLSISLLLISALAAVIVCLCVLYTRVLTERRVRELRNGVRTTTVPMVNNPIYVEEFEGPVYDCIKTQASRDEVATGDDKVETTCSTESTDQQHYENLHRRPVVAVNQDCSLPVSPVDNNDRAHSLGCRGLKQQHQYTLSIEPHDVASSDDEPYTVMMPTAPAAHC